MTSIAMLSARISRFMNRRVSATLVVAVSPAALEPYESKVLDHDGQLADLLARGYQAVVCVSGNRACWWRYSMTGYATERQAQAEADRLWEILPVPMVELFVWDRGEWAELLCP